MAPLGNGLFQLESFSPMHSLTLSHSAYTFRRPAQVEQIEVIFVPDAQTELHAFDQGVVDAIHLEFTEWVKHRSVKQLRHEEFPAMYFEFIGFNFQREFFRDMQVRQGIAHAFNISEVISSIYLNHAVRAISPIHPASWMNNSAVHGISYDPVQARLLLQSIYIEEPLVILANLESIEHIRIAERLAASLHQVGLPAIVEILPFYDYLERIETHNFDLYIGWMQLTFRPNILFMFQDDNGLFHHDPLLVSLFSTALSATTENGFLQAIGQFQRSFSERLPVISLAFRNSAVLAGMRIQGDLQPSPDNIFVNINEWVIE